MTYESFSSSSDIEILLAGNIAADDLMWVVRCSIAEMHRFFQNPVQWVAALSTLQGWVDPVTGKAPPTPVLTPDFAVLTERTDVIDPDGWVTIQGISDTNAITVVSSRVGAIRSVLADDEAAGALAERYGLGIDELRRWDDARLLEIEDPFGPFWKAAGNDPNNPPTYRKELLLNIIRTNARFYGHFEITGPEQTPSGRAIRRATFLLAYVFDDAGFATMLTGLDQRVLVVDRGTAERGGALTIRAGQTPRGMYANLEALTTSDTPPPPEEPFGCINLDGPYDPDNSTGTVDGALLKRYESPIPPPPLPPSP